MKTLTRKLAKRPPAADYRLTPRTIAILREAEDPKTKWKSFDSVEALMAHLTRHEKRHHHKAV